MGAGKLPAPIFITEQSELGKGPEPGFRAFGLLRTIPVKEREIVLAKRKRDANVSMAHRPLRRLAPIFILPTFAAFCIGFVWPFIQGIYLSFCKFTITSNAKWIGLDNYVKALQDPGFLHAFWYTALVAVVSLVIINLLVITNPLAITKQNRQK
jgi:ABC-type spermidine/putrescine transport system permease subunit I